jgi:Kef-type K+ transport system membrane component KefB
MRSIILYLLFVGVPVLFILGILHVGPTSAPMLTAAPSTSAIPDRIGLHLPTLLAQLAVILVLARLVGQLFRRIHQPQVIGEMVAGILLGPSFLGTFSPGLSSLLFPQTSLGFLNALSQVGLLFFMFLVGLDLDLKLLRKNKHTAVITSHVSITFPFMLGAGLALYLYPRLSTQNVSFPKFALFFGTAMSVTAFPVLARILSERKLLKTRVGAIAIACAAIDDVTAWCILAAVVLLFRSAEVLYPLWLTLVGLAGYVVAMVLFVRPLLMKFEETFHSRNRLSKDQLAAIILVVLASAYATDLLGVHSIFGAFLVGVLMPKDRDFVEALINRLQDLVVVLLLPLFFALTGLRTSFGLVAGSEMWIYCLLIITVAIVGKAGASTLSARLTGMSWREAGALGILLNTRGLMELVILNIGLEIGAITQSVFTMMVLMAVVTTFMTTPLIEWIYPARKRGSDADRAALDA